jgi:type IV secretory pathway VirB6-like protein
MLNSLTEASWLRSAFTDWKEVKDKMKTILAALFAVMIGVTFAGSTFAAEEKKMDAPAAAPAGEMKKDESKKTETKTETKTEGKDGKKSKKTKKTTKTEEKTSKTEEKK